MNKLISLIKVTLKNSTNDLSFSNKKKNTSKKTKIITYTFLIIVLLFFVCLPFGFMGYMQGFNFKNYDVNFYKLLIPTFGLIIPFLTIPFLLTNLFLNSTDEVLLSYPLTSKTIFTSRIVSSILQSYLFVLMFLSPLLLGFIIGSNASFDIYITFIIFTILSPIIPLCFLGFVFTLLSKFINFKTHKNVLGVLSMILPIVFAVGIQLIMSFLGQNIEGGEYDQVIINTVNSSGNILSIINFLFIPFVIAFSSSNILIRLLFLLVSIVVTFAVSYLFITLSSKIYYNHMRKTENVKKIYDNVKDKDYKNSSCFKSLVFSDVKEILRNPSYNFNYIFPLIIFPLITIISFLFSGGKDLISSPEFEQIKQNITFANPLVITVSICFILFISSMSSSSITAISRFGNNAYFIKVIPVKPIKIILSRIFFGVISTFITTLILIISCASIQILSVLDAIILLLILIPFIILLNLIAIYFDVKYPKLNWSTPNELLKNSGKFAIYMFSCWGAGLLLIGFGALFTFALPVNGYIIYSIIFILSIFSCYLIYKKLDKPNIFNNF